VSVGPPAGKGTTIVMGRDGKDSATALTKLATIKMSEIERSFVM
jgi:hypothetical protein